MPGSLQQFSVKSATGGVATQYSLTSCVVSSEVQLTPNQPGSTVREAGLSVQEVRLIAGEADLSVHEVHLIAGEADLPIHEADFTAGEAGLTSQEASFPTQEVSLAASEPNLITHDPSFAKERLTSPLVKPAP
jgi:hypothetical protein